MRVRRVMVLALAVCLRVSSASAQRGLSVGLPADWRYRLGRDASFGVENLLLPGIGSPGRLGYRLRAELIAPVPLGERIQMLHRVVWALSLQPPADPEQGHAFGATDLNYQLFFGPQPNGSFVWGAGPALVVPAATGRRLGAGRWSLGPTAALVYQPPRLILALVVANVWGVAGDLGRAKVNTFAVQPIVNVGLPGGWLLQSSPEIFADWTAPANDRWVVPLGAGVGKVFSLFGVPAIGRVVVYRNFVTPSPLADWQIRFGADLLFPRAATDAQTQKKPRSESP